MITVITNRVGDRSSEAIPFALPNPYSCQHGYWKERCAAQLQEKFHSLLGSTHLDLECFSGTHPHPGSLFPPDFSVHGSFCKASFFVIQMGLLIKLLLYEHR